MNFEELEDLGFELVGSGDEPDVVAELLSPIANPISRRFIDRATFRLEDDRLRPAAPAELVGLPPLSLTGVERMSQINAHLQEAFDHAVLRMQRRSADLQALGLQPRVDPDTLILTAEIRTHSLELLIAADREGRFRVASARRGPATIDVPAHSGFEITEFQDPAALRAFLEVLVLGEKALEAPAPAATPAPVAAAPVAPTESNAAPEPTASPSISTVLTLGDLVRCFGEAGVVPVRTPVEVVVDLRVDGVPHRFAASRVVGVTFRGLLAGPRGKVWADRFDLGDFTGVAELAARELRVARNKVELVDVRVASPQ